MANKTPKFTLKSLQTPAELMELVRYLNKVVEESELVAALNAHKEEADPHPVYMTDVEGTAAIATHNADGTAHPAAIAVHRSEVDPHPVYMTQAEGDALYAPAGSSGTNIVIADGEPGDTTALWFDIE